MILEKYKHWNISKPIVGSNNIVFLKVEDKKETNIDKINIEQIKEDN